MKINDVTEDEEMQIHTKVKLLILEWFPVTLKTPTRSFAKEQSYQTIFLLIFY